MKWLYRIVSRLLPCRHRWEHYSDYRFRDNAVYIPDDYQYYIKILKCKRCGELKGYKISADGFVKE